MLNLRFSCYETAGNKIMALDGIKRILLVADQQNAGAQYLVIKLADIKNLLVKRYIYAVNRATAVLLSQRHPRAIYLEFIFSNKPATFPLVFYTTATDNKADLSRLEKKTYNWQRLPLQLSGHQATHAQSS